MKIIDLTKTLENGMGVYPGDPDIQINQIHHLDKEGWRLKTLYLGSHTGSHVDAFAHMDKNGQTLEKMELGNFFGKTKLFSFKKKLSKSEGMIFNKEIFNLEKAKGIVKLKPRFIALSHDCEFPVEVERFLLENRVVTITDLVNVDKLPKIKPFMLYAFPLKIKDGDGSPVRAVAILD